MVFKVEDIIINMSVGQCVSVLNYIFVLCIVLYGDCEKEFNCFINEMCDKCDEKYELNNCVFVVLFFFVNISKECYCVEFSELMSDEVIVFIGVMNYFCVVVSLFLKWLVMLN